MASSPQNQYGDGCSRYGDGEDQASVAQGVAGLGEGDVVRLEVAFETRGGGEQADAFNARVTQAGEDRVALNTNVGRLEPPVADDWYIEPPSVARRESDPDFDYEITALRVQPADSFQHHEVGEADWDVTAYVPADRFERAVAAAAAVKASGRLHVRPAEVAVETAYGSVRTMRATFDRVEAGDTTVVGFPTAKTRAALSELDDPDRGDQPRSYALRVAATEDAGTAGETGGSDDPAARLTIEARMPGDDPNPTVTVPLVAPEQAGSDPAYPAISEDCPRVELPGYELAGLFAGVPLAASDLSCLLATPADGLTVRGYDDRETVEVADSTTWPFEKSADRTYVSGTAYSIQDSAWLTDLAPALPPTDEVALVFTPASNREGYHLAVLADDFEVYASAIFRGEESPPAEVA